MNLSHAVAVVLAVATGVRGAGGGSRGRRRAEELAPASEIEAAVGHWDLALEAIDFYDTGHRDRSLRDWRKLVVARPLTTREVAILRGVANRIMVALRIRKRLNGDRRGPRKPRTTSAGSGSFQRPRDWSD